MEGLIVLIVIGLAIIVLSGPIAFIVAMVCLNKINRLEEHIRLYLSRPRGFEPEAAKPRPSIPEMPAKPVSSLVPGAVEITTLPVKEPSVQPEVSEETAAPKASEPAFAEVRDMKTIFEKYSGVPTPEKLYSKESARETVGKVSLEQAIGTRWILIAGIIVVIIGVCFFLKYAYEKMWIGPWARVGIVAAGGLVALIVGEITRRRGYEIVAKGTAALGFAMLYAAVFSAYHWYHLIGTVPAFGAAIIVTAAAMTYAVILNEIVIAFLSLLGGFLTPLIITTGKNLPHHLFGYVLILSCGAMLCGIWRRWRAVNVMAFIGTFLLYTLWFEKFVRNALPYVESQENVIRVAECWLGVFFIVYLILPLLYGFVKKIQACKEDIFIPIGSGIITFFYLWTMLEEFFRTELAVCSALMGLMYLAAAGVALVRCREDKDLRTILAVMGTAFITAAIPLYFETYAVVTGWTIEAVVLIGAGVLYASYCLQVLGIIVTALSIAGLCWIGQNEGTFTVVFNKIFGTWIFAAAGAFASHLFYRRKKEMAVYRTLSEILFLVGAAILFAACSLEWDAYCEMALSKPGWDNIFEKGMLCLLSILGIMLTAVGLFYVSILIRGAGILAAAAGIMGLVSIFGHTGIYHPVWNSIFGTWLAVGAGVGICHLLYRFWKEPRGEDYDFWNQWLYVAAAAVILGACCLEWHRYWSHHELEESAVESRTMQGVLYSVSLLILMLAIRPLSPRGIICRSCAAIAAGIAGFIAVAAADVLYWREFRFLFNGLFAAQAAPVAAVFIAAVFLRKEKQNRTISPKWYQAFGLAGVIGLWAVLSLQVYWYWYCRNEFGSGVLDWRFKMNMCLSLLWAGYATVLLIVGFWKQLAVLRYLALGLFGLLLGKVFIVDMSTVKNVYRIAAFLATGLTLVGVSYLYQFLKKKGFFDKLLAGQQQESDDKI